MKIYATGVTKQQRGGGTTLGYEPVSDLFVKALTALGHEVDHVGRPAGADLSGYDLMLIGLVPFFSIASNNLYPTLDAINQAKVLGIPIIFYFDDWNFPQFVANVKTHLRYREEQLLKPFFKSRRDYAWASDPLHANMCLAVMENLTDPAYWPPVLIPAFTWGNHDELGSKVPWMSDVTYVDPSILARDYEIEKRLPWYRKHEWVLGTVSNQLTWLESLGLDWDLNHLGGRASRAPHPMLEGDLVGLYGQAWGVLSPPYKRILGTGWWRNRFVYAARSQAILLCDPAEAPQLGEAYQLDPHVVEKMTVTQLETLAFSQRDAFFRHQASLTDVKIQMSQAIRRAQEMVA